jgi:hypothetical protein
MHDKQTTAELEQEVRYLTQEIGVPEALARLQLRDEDLWLVIPEQRFAWEPGEEDVRQWELAVDFADALSQGFTESKAINHDTRQLLWDMRERAGEALQRARERAK